MSENAADRFYIVRMGIEVQLAGQVAEKMNVHLDAGFALYEIRDRFRERRGRPPPVLGIRKQPRGWDGRYSDAVGFQIGVEQSAAVLREHHLEGDIRLCFVGRNDDVAVPVAPATDLNDVPVDLDPDQV